MKKREFYKIHLIYQLRLVILKLIRIYQATLSHNHGPRKGLSLYGCKYEPSCSEYAYQAIEKYGIIKGGIKSTWRLLRCNPFSKGGYDPLK